VSGQSTQYREDALTRAFTAAISEGSALLCDSIARAVIEAGVAPDGAAGCAVRTDAGWRTESGGARETLFDLASVTKPMTAWAIAEADMDPRSPLRAYWRAAEGTASADVPLEEVLAHRAGLEAHVALFGPLLRGERVDAAAALRLAADARRADATGPCPPGGFAPVYSDMGYAIAGAALAARAGARDAGEATCALVAARLGVGTSLGTARELSAAGVDVVALAAPTEHVPWRGGLVRGRVHDENAWALTGEGGSGHAGMFGTIDAVLAFGRAVLDATLAGDARFEWLVRERPGGTLRAGFDGKSAEGSSAGSVAGPRAFGHLGFTGTSLWIDPDARAVVALLTNRVCPTRDNVAIRAARPLVHDALFRRAARLAGS
jgi:CubicO group peptidase (beta-lactamase class C family)